VRDRPKRWSERDANRLQLIGEDRDTVAVCEALTATTRAPAIGAFVELATSPVIEPVVPARAQIAPALTTAASAKRRIDDFTECSIRTDSRRKLWCHSTV
jgi:hypothetical protein